MTLRCQDIIMYRGDTREVSVDIVAADGSAVDSSDPLLNVSWRMAGTLYSDADLILRQSSDGGITWGPGGQATFVLAAADTANLTPGYYFHEMRVSDDADVWTAMNGTVVIKPTRTIPVAP